MISKFDNSHSPAIRLDLDGDFTDKSGNGLHLTGTGAVFRNAYGNSKGLVGGSAARPSPDSALRIAGDLTVQCLCIMRVAPSNANVFYFIGSIANTLAHNIQYQLYLPTQDSITTRSESGAGVNADATFTAGAQGLPALGVPFLLTFRRASGVRKVSINALPFGSPSAALTAPDGGTSSMLNIRGSATSPELLALRVIPSALTDAEDRETFNATLGEEFGSLDPEVLSLWVGASTTSGATVAVKLTYASDNVRLKITGPSGVAYSSSGSAAHGGALKFALTGLDADTAYTYEVQCDGATIPGPTGAFRTLPVGASSFTVAFGGDADTGSTHEAFGSIRAKDPLMFLHLGDLHYANITTNDPAAFDAALDSSLGGATQGALYREVATAYVWDDHDYGGNDSDGNSATKPAAAATYRARVPHYSLPDSVGIWQTFDIGRVRFIVTDQRSSASPKANTDNSSKTMLGATQKAWFKNLLSNSAGKLIVWVCPRVWGGVATAGADHWGGFTTERTEIADYIKANAHGRVLVLSADRHSLDIDDGSNHDFATGGGEPMPTFQAAPLDQFMIPTYGGGTYSGGSFGTANGQFGTMEIADSGGATIGVTWRGWDSAGSQLVSHTFSVTV